MQKTFKFFVFVSVTLFLFATPVFASPPLGDLTIPPSRVPDWYVPILVNTSNWTVVPVHAVSCADNTTEDATVIRNAISTASPNTILQLDANCTYNIQSGIITLNKSNVVIRGGGMDSTIIHFGHSTGGTNCYIPPPNILGSGMGGEALMWICTSVSTGPAINWTAGYTHGTTDITIADDSGFAEGDWIGLHSAFPSELGVGNNATTTLNGARNLYLAKIATKRPGGLANVLRLDRSLRNDHTNSIAFQQVVYKWRPIENSGVESLTLKPYDVNNSSEVLRFANVAGAWATDVRIDGSFRTSFSLANTARSLVSRIYLNNQTATPYGGTAFTFGPGAIDNVVMDSIFVRNPVDVKLESGSSGNAWVYNYQRRNSVPRNCDGTGGDGLMKGERAIFFHGLANESLVEGNDTECQLEIDNFWGPEQYRNTIYRNRQGVVTMGRSTNTGWGFSTGDYNSYSNSFDTNILMNTITRMYHGDIINSNFDIVDNAPGTFNLWLERNLVQDALNLIPRPDTTSVNNVASALTTQGVGDWGNKNFPASLIYTSKPSWWLSAPWPAIGADVDVIGGTMHKLPAQCRYEGSTTGDCAPAGGGTDTTAPSLTLSTDTPSITLGSPVSLTLSSNETLNSSGASFYQGANLIGTDTTSSYSLTYTPTATGTLSLSARGADVAGNQGTSNTVSLTVTAPAQTTLSSLSLSTPTLDINNLSSVGRSFYVSFYNPGSTTTLSTSLVTGTASTITFTPTNLSSGTYDVRVKRDGSLSRKKANLSLQNNTSLNTFSPLISGDLNSDNAINALDWSMMSPDWFQTNKPSDINGDGITNALDFTWLNRNWFLIGE